MQYGYFDDEKREYVITRPDTPAAWANYLGSPACGALISNNAGGYSFVESGANGRLLRYRFDESDKPGRYLYVQDEEDKDYWSVSWQPVGKDLSVYESTCRHGLGYTVMESVYAKIRSTACYYVPEGETHEVWRLTVKNESERVRRLTVTGYAEFTSNSNYEQDLVNLQYSRFITRTVRKEGRIVQLVHANLSGMKEGSHHSLEERFFGLAGAKVSSACGDREAFLGRYRSYGNPIRVEQGDLGGEMNYNGYSCGALCTKLVLAPGEKKTIAFLLGRKEEEEQQALLRRYARVEEETEKDLTGLKRLWEERLSHFQVKTPDPVFDTMLNTWNAYNCYMTFLWSRAASFVYCGLRNGFGYRDTVQDIQGIVHLEPELAAEKIRFMLSAQASCGAGLPLVKFTHNPGHEDTPEQESYVRETGHAAYRADDALWLFPTIWKYLSETGNSTFLQEQIPFADQGTGSVYEHLKRAISFSLNHLGPHGMPAGLYADWNDCLRLGEMGESTFVAFQFCMALRILQDLAQLKGEPSYAAYLEEQRLKQESILQEICWDTDRFIRGFTQEGEIIGGRASKEADMWLNPQSWAVLSQVAQPEQARVCMDLAGERLNTPYGLLLMDPPYHAHAFEGALAVIYNAGSKENAGIFSQTQGWAILAEALLGRGDQAYLYFMENAPANCNDQAQIRRMEPYCYGQFTEGKASPHFGRSHVHWLTGTASTMMVGCVEGILGMRPDLNGLRLCPAVPAKWDSFRIVRDFRGCRLRISVQNPNHVSSGVKTLTVNKERLEGDYIPAGLLKQGIENEIVAVMG